MLQDRRRWRKQSQLATRRPPPSSSASRQSRQCLEVVHWPLPAARIGSRQAPARACCFPASSWPRRLRCHWQGRPARWRPQPLQPLQRWLPLALRERWPCCGWRPEAGSTTLAAGHLPLAEGGQPQPPVKLPAQWLPPWPWEGQPPPRRLPPPPPSLPPPPPPPLFRLTLARGPAACPAQRALHHRRCLACSPRVLRCSAVCWVAGQGRWPRRRRTASPPPGAQTVR